MQWGKCGTVDKENPYNAPDNEEGSQSVRKQIGILLECFYYKIVFCYCYCKKNVVPGKEFSKDPFFHPFLIANILTEKEVISKDSGHYDIFSKNFHQNIALRTIGILHSTIIFAQWLL